MESDTVLNRDSPLGSVWYVATRGAGLTGRAGDTCGHVASTHGEWLEQAALQREFRDRLRDRRGHRCSCDLSSRVSDTVAPTAPMCGESGVRFISRFRAGTTIRFVIRQVNCYGSTNRVCATCLALTGNRSALLSFGLVTPPTDPTLTLITVDRFYMFEFGDPRR
jgi:hypothetical protein